MSELQKQIEKETEEIIQRGLGFQRKTIESILGFTQCMLDLKEASAIVQGGSDFAKVAEERWGISPSMASNWLGIANRIKDLEKLFTTSKQLPTGIRSLYLLSTIDNKDLEANVNLISSNMTQEDVKALKHKLFVERVEKENPIEEKQVKEEPNEPPAVGSKMNIIEEQPVNQPVGQSELEFISCEEVLRIVEACFDTFASSYTQVGVNMASDLLNEKTK